jgi:hypothetical protein
MFLENCPSDDIDLPNTDEGKYNMIKNAVLHFNNRLSDNLQTNNELEEVDRVLTDSHLLILAHYLRLSILKNTLFLFSRTWQPFKNDIGLKNFSYQISALKEIVKDEQNTIDAIILHQTEDFI